MVRSHSQVTFSHYSVNQEGDQVTLGPLDDVASRMTRRRPRSVGEAAVIGGDFGGKASTPTSGAAHDRTLLRRTWRGPAGRAIPGELWPRPATIHDQPTTVRPTTAPAWRKALGRGVAPYLLVLDVLAWAAGTRLVGHFDAHHVTFLFVMLPALAMCSAYKSRLSMSVLEDGARLTLRILLSAALVSSVDLLAGGDSDGRDFLRTAAVVAMLVCAFRAFGYATVRRARARGLVTHRTLVLGAGLVGVQIVHLLQEHPEYGLRPVGFLDNTPLMTPDKLPAPVLGGADRLAEIICAEGIEVVIVAFGGLPGHALVEVLRTCDRLECEIFLVPRLYELHAVAVGMDAIWGMPLIRHRRAAFRSAAWPVKRVFDVVVSGLALVILSPVLVLTAIGVRLEGGAGIIFRQTRVGLDGRPFEVLKFRSLRPADETESATRWNVAHDDRLGPFGAFMRKTSLDELPQLWNICRGDMSLVGPRPERPHFVANFASTLPRYVARHRVPAGLTGWAQVHGLRGDTSIAERARFDNYYIENWSLGLDLRIILMTMISVLRRDGA